MGKKILYRLQCFGVALLMAAAVLPVPAAAVSPQEGWFVRSRESITANGRTQDYFIIDNKMTSDPWYVELRTRILLNPNDPWVSLPAAASNINYGALAIFPTWYQGFSDVSWLIDEDWLIGVNVSGVTQTVVPGQSAVSFRLYVFDRNKVPVFQFNSTDSDYGAVFYGQNCIVGTYSNSTVNFGYGWPIVDGFNGYLSLRPSASGNPPALFDLFLTQFSLGIENTLPIAGTNINDLCVAAIPNFTTTSSGYQGEHYARIAITWAIPVSKAPAGTQVGDRWPKVAPIDVQFEDKYQAWKDAAIAQTPVSDANNVDELLQDNLDQVEESTQLGSNVATAWNGMAPVLAVIEPFSPFLLVAVGLFVLAFFMKKGMG